MNRWKEHFSLLIKREIPVESHLPYTQPLEENFEDLAEDVLIEEIRTAVKQLKNRKAPGIDGIQAEIYKYGGETVIKWLHRVIQACWNSEEIPEDWRKMVLIPLHKSNSRQDCNNSRGISLLVIAGKIFTKIILNRISEVIESLLRENQCGFRTKRGCCDQIFTLRQIIEKSLEFNNNLYICFVDFKQAYDSVWRDTLWQALPSYGIPEKLVRLLKGQ